ncbi:MAG: hypothetical protein AAF236_07820 [Verrucomicrobiota bacterium]
MSEAYQAAVSEKGSGGGKGCTFCGFGCLALIVATVCLVVAAVWGLNYYVDKGIAQYTSSEPVALEREPIDPQTAESANLRFDLFRNALANDEEIPPLLLTGDDINALIASHPSLEPFADQVYIRIVEDRLAASLSLDLDSLDLPPIPLVGDALEGRYLNAEAVLTLDFVDGAPDIRLVDITVDGQSVPASVMTTVASEDLLKDLRDDPQFRRSVQQVGDMRIEDGYLIVTPKVEP